MNYDYVDQIVECQPNRSILTRKAVTKSEPFFYWLPDGRKILSPAVLCESIGQSANWLIQISTDLKKSSVFLSDEKTEYHGYAKIGDVLSIQVTALDFNDDTVTTHSEVKNGKGELLVSTVESRGFLIETSELWGEGILSNQLKNKLREDKKNCHFVSSPIFTPGGVTGAQSFSNLQFVDGILEFTPLEKVIGFKNFSSVEDYFRDHFPKKPIVPGVLLLTFLGEVCQYLVKDHLEQKMRHKALIPIFTKNTRFRKFVEPGDQCILEAQVIEGDPKKNNELVVIRTVMKVNQNRVMQSDMGFKTQFINSHENSNL